MIAKLLSILGLLLHSPTRCEPGFYISVVALTDAFECVQTPPRSICDAKAGCDDNTPDPRYPLDVRCPDKQVAVISDDVRSIRCIRKP